MKVVIPSALRERVLEEIHEGHTGIVKMKSMARIHLWWPKINLDIESTASKCTACQENSRDPARAPIHPWEQPRQLWTRIHVDFAGPFEGSMWFIIVDAHTYEMARSHCHEDNYSKQYYHGTEIVIRKVWHSNSNSVRQRTSIHFRGVQSILC